MKNPNRTRSLTITYRMSLAYGWQSINPIQSNPIQFIEMHNKRARSKTVNNDTV